MVDSGRSAVTANAYLGAWGIKAALDLGADVVICPRVTDAAVVIGPAAWKFNWQRQDYDALAGALAAGHVIECGAQATGGNYAFFQEVPSFHNIGYPIAEIEANGNFTITKQACYQSFENPLPKAGFNPAAKSVVNGFVFPKF